jgi:hypothetical protein
MKYILAKQLMILGLILVGQLIATSCCGPKKREDDSIRLILLLNGRLENTGRRVAIFLDNELMASAHLKPQPSDVFSDDEPAINREMATLPLILSLNSGDFDGHTRLKVKDLGSSTELIINVADIVAKDIDEVYALLSEANGQLEWSHITRARGKQVEE